MNTSGWRDNKTESGYFQQLDHIRTFQIGDLKKASSATANFLACIGCFNVTEFLGGVENERLGANGKGAVAQRLKAGFPLVHKLFVYHETELIDLRNSMTHAYIGAIRRYNHVRIRNSLKPIPADEPTGMESWS